MFGSLLEPEHHVGDLLHQLLSWHWAPVHQGTGVKLASDVKEADFVLNSGTNTIRTLPTLRLGNMVSMFPSLG